MDFSNYLGEGYLLEETPDKIGGNPVLMSAYLHNLEGYNPIEVYEIRQYIKSYLVNVSFSKTLNTFRKRGDIQPDSIDNILAHIHFDTVNAHDLQFTGWYFNGHRSDEYTWLQCIKESFIVAWKTRNLEGSDKRNYWWENGYYAVGKFANLLTPQFRHYALMRVDKFNFAYWLMFCAHCIYTAKLGTDSDRNLCVMMLEDLKSERLIKMFDKKAQYKRQFDADYPLNILV